MGFGLKRQARRVALVTGSLRAAVTRFGAVEARGWDVRPTSCPLSSSGSSVQRVAIFPLFLHAGAQGGTGKAESRRRRLVGRSVLRRWQGLSRRGTSL